MKINNLHEVEMKIQKSDGTKNSPATLADSMSVFQKSPTGRTLSQQKSSLRVAQLWLDELGADTPLDQIQPSAIRRVLNGLEICGGTKNRYSAHLSVLYRIAAVEFDYDGPNPVRQMVRWRENSPRIRSLSRDELNRLLEACRKASYPKLRLMVLMAVTTGMRRGTLGGIKHSDIDLKTGRIVVDRTKNGTAYVAVLTESVLEELRPWHREDRPDELLFAGRTGAPYNLDKEYNRLCKQVGLGDDVCFHTLRHTAASMAAQSGASTIQIMDLLNHKTPTMAARYSHMNTASRESLIGSVFGDIR